MLPFNPFAHVGLDPSVTKEELTAIFGQYGELADVRLVTYRNGHSKGQQDYIYYFFFYFLLFSFS